MISSRTVASIGLAILVIVPVIRASQGNDGTANLLRRVQVLDTMVANLQTRVEALERASTVARATLAPASAPSAKGVWRSLSKGMSMPDVRRILGEPTRVEGGYLSYWYYPEGGKVTFDNSNLVFGWDEPR